MMLGVPAGPAASSPRFYGFGCLCSECRHVTLCLAIGTELCEEELGETLLVPPCFVWVLHLNSDPCPSACTLPFHLSDPDPDLQSWLPGLTSDLSPHFEPVQRCGLLADPIYHEHICSAFIHVLWDQAPLKRPLPCLPQCCLHLLTRFHFWSSPFSLLLDRAWHFTVWNYFLWFRYENCSWFNKPGGYPGISCLSASPNKVYGSGVQLQRCQCWLWVLALLAFLVIGLSGDLVPGYDSSAAELAVGPYNASSH